jgi:hypothetical protein
MLCNVEMKHTKLCKNETKIPRSQPVARYKVAIGLCNWTLIVAMIEMEGKERLLHRLIYIQCTEQRSMRASNP